MSSKSLLRRAAKVFAENGMTGVLNWRERRRQRDQAEVDLKTTRVREVVEAKTKYQELKKQFDLRTKELGYTSLENYYWYHTVDLGNGLVTPGDYDYREELSNFHFPENMKGMKVLDVGSATGFFAFEFERRGAEVTSVELPSFFQWDMLMRERDGIERGIKTYFKTDSAEEASRLHLDGPFQFCHSALGSKVKRCYSSIYDLTAEKVGQRSFDLVYAGDILLHLFSPLKALDVLSTLCHGSLILTIDVPFPGPTDQPLLRFEGWSGHEGDRRTWWRLSATGAEHMLKRLGFPTVSVVGSYSGVARREWAAFSRQVICAEMGKLE